MLHDELARRARQNHSMSGTSSLSFSKSSSMAGVPFSFENGTPGGEEARERPRVTIAICTQREATAAMLRTVGDVLHRAMEYSAEMLVVAPVSAQGACAASLEFTPARLLSAPDDTTRRELRARAMREATGEIVVFLDDLTFSGAGWRSRLDALIGESGETAFDLSVVVPAHNAARLLPLSLAAVDANTLDRRRWELIVVDDASSDVTAFRA